VLLVGINPGVMSATMGHHFAGPSNRFWGLLYEAGIVPEPITHEDDVRLPEWGIGMTNLVARPSPGIDDLSPAEYQEGWKILEKKIERFRPRIVAFVGVTMYRALWRVLGHVEAPIIKPGFQNATVHGARLFVLPNPSGRNAHFSYDDMLRAFRGLADAINAPRPPARGRAASSSATRAAGAAEKSPRAAGKSTRTPPSWPAAGPVRKATRKRAGSRS
jgi:TDG/mug DNA glycosylase family protein